MKLASLRARGVYEHLSLDLNFKPDLNLLVGVNGSGKTTALKLIHALLGPSLEDLYLIPFDSVAIDLSDGNQLVRVSAEKSKEGLQISASGIGAPLRLPLLDDVEAANLFRQANREAAVAEFVATHCTKNKVWTFLKELRSPLFLGLDRRGGIEDFEEDWIAQPRLWRETIRAARRHPVVRDGVNEVQALLSNEYKRLRSIQEHYVRRLRKAVIISSFQYSELSSHDIEEMQGEVRIAQRAQLMARKSEILAALQNIDAESNDVLKEVNKFFQKLDTLYSSLEEMESSAKPAVSIEWLMNKAQINRVTNLLSVIDEHRGSVERLFAHISRFQSAINRFYVDSRKQVSIDEVGQLVVERSDKVDIGTSALSSGERQLLVMLGQLFFRRDRSVFIIDEPELSLHVRWQKTFVDTALEAQRSGQLILATHSPEIVGEHKASCINVRPR